MRRVIAVAGPTAEIVVEQVVVVTVVAGGHGTVFVVGRIEIGLLVGGVEVGDRTAGTVPLQRTGNLRPVEAVGQVCFAVLDRPASGIGNLDWALERPASVVVAQRQRVLERLGGAADRDVAAEPFRPHVTWPEARLPVELSGNPAGFGNDVRDLARQAGNLQRCAIDDLDLLDLVGGNLLQAIEDRFRLERQSLAVDQHVDAGLAEPAALIAAGDREAGYLVDHVERAFRRIAREVSRGVDDVALAACVRDVERRVRWRSRVLRQRGHGHQQQG